MDFSLYANNVVKGNFTLVNYPGRCLTDLERSVYEKLPLKIKCHVIVMPFYRFLTEEGKEEFEQPSFVLHSKYGLFVFDYGCVPSHNVRKRASIYFFHQPIEEVLKTFTFEPLFLRRHSYTNTVGEDFAHLILLAALRQEAELLVIQNYDFLTIEREIRKDGTSVFHINTRKFVYGVDKGVVVVHILRDSDGYLTRHITESGEVVSCGRLVVNNEAPLLRPEL